MCEKPKQTQWSPEHRETIKLLDIPIDSIQPEDLPEVVSKLLATKQKSIIACVNIKAMNLAYSSPSMRNYYCNASINYCDGAGVVLGAKLAGKHLPGRMTAASFIFDLCTKWQDDGVSVYFLGGAPGIAEQAKSVLERKYPRLKIAGTHHGYFNKHGKENDDVIMQINSSKPDILFIGFGTPIQEKWVTTNFDQLDVPILWPIGALVDYLSGKVPRSPQWMQDHGLEWLFRFIVEPHRLFTRYIIGNPLFILRVLLHRFKNRH